MVSLEPVQSSLGSIDAPSSPRISFQAEFLDASIFKSITPESEEDEHDPEKQKERAINSEFEFLSSNNASISSSSSSSSSNITLLTADELFFEGKLLPFWQMQHSEKLKKISLKAKEETEEEDDEKENDPVEEKEREEEEVKKEEDSKVNWLMDEDPSPRPPNCTVLWKELLRLKKQRASSSSSVSVLSSSSSSSSLSDTASKQEGIKEKKQVKGMKKLERTRSTSIRIRPMINVPICTQVKSSPLPPLFSLKKRK